MTPNIIRNILRYLGTITTLTGGLMAAEYRGVVRFSGLPVPGATVTLTQGDTRFVSTTDERGAFAFPAISGGTWAIRIEMLGFATLDQPIGIAEGVAGDKFHLKMLPAAAPPIAATPRLPENRRAAPATFRRMDVTQSSETESFSSQGTIKSDEVAGLTQRAANSFLVEGSVSSALGMPPQNDWGHFPGLDPAAGPGLIAIGGRAEGHRVGAALPIRASSGRTEESAWTSWATAESTHPRSNTGSACTRATARARSAKTARSTAGHACGAATLSGDARTAGSLAGNGLRDPRGMYMGHAMFSLDNSVWDARTFSVTGANVEKPAYANARGGVMFGGPLRIPKLVSVERRILFTVDFQFQRNRNGVVSQPVNMPTTLERSGDFSRTQLAGANVLIYDPTTGTPFPGNKIPVSRISAAALSLLNYYPSPNLPFAARNYQSAWTSSNNSYNLNSRVSNIKIGTNDRLNAAFGYQDTSSRTPNLFQFVDTGSGRGINASLAWSHNFTTRLINNVQYNFSRNRQLSTPYFANLSNVASELGITGTSQASTNWGPPNINFTNYGSLTDSNYSLTRNQTGSAGESLVWIRASHNFVFGGDYRRLQFNQFSDNNGRGTYTFNGLASSYLVDGVAQNGTGYDLADFLLGLPTTASVRYGNPDKYFRGSGYDLFLNDD